MHYRCCWAKFFILIDTSINPHAIISLRYIHKSTFLDISLFLCSKGLLSKWKYAIRMYANKKIKIASRFFTFRLILISPMKIIEGTSARTAECKSRTGTIPTAPPGYSIAPRNIMKIIKPIIMVRMISPILIRILFTQSYYANFAQRYV